MNRITISWTLLLMLLVILLNLFTNIKSWFLPPFPVTNKQKTSQKTLLPPHLVCEDSEDELAGSECLDDPHDHLLVRRLRHVALKADVREVRFWRDVDGHVAALQHGHVYYQPPESMHVFFFFFLNWRQSQVIILTEASSGPSWG